MTRQGRRLKEILGGAVVQSSKARRADACAAGGLGAAQGPQKPTIFTFNKMDSDSFLSGYNRD